MDIKQLGNVASARALRLAKEIALLQPSAESLLIRFQFSELCARPDLEALGNQLISIYSFHLSDRDSRDQFLRSFNEAKKARLAGLAYPRRNTNIAELSADCLYVGTSRNTRQRLREHLGFGNDRTYSLHLGKWATLLPGGVEMRVHPFNVALNNLHLLTYLEDALAENLKPLLGRRGNL
jgi:hypothetical protein